MKSLMLILILLLLPSVSAHLAGGEDVVKGEYLIDFGYSVENIVEEQPVELLFVLVNSSDFENIPIDRTWIRVSDEDSVVFAGNFNPDGSSVAFTYSFPDDGNYSITSRFFSNDVQLVDHVFEVSVDSDDVDFSPQSIIFILLGIFILIYFIRKKKHV